MKIVLSLFLSLVGLFLNAQKIQIGIMGGINTTIQDVTSTQKVVGSDSKLGYNALLFGRGFLGGMFIQPEIGYFNNRASLLLDKNTPSIEATVNLGQFYSGLMLGYKIGTIRVQAGPLFYRDVNQSIENKSPFDVNISSYNDPQNKWGGQVGIGLNIAKRWQIDARYQQLLNTSNFQSTIDNVSETIHSKQSNLSLFLGYTIIRN